MNPPKKRLPLLVFMAGMMVGVVLMTVIALFSSALRQQFEQGAVLGFCIGLGIILGSTLLNLAVGLLDQAKKEISGS